MKKSEFPELSKLYAKLKPFYETTKRGRARPESMFQNCVRASFAKAYEFNVLASASAKAVPAFFLAPALRSICEDVILLRYLSSLNGLQRNRLVGLLMSHEIL